MPFYSYLDDRTGKIFDILQSMEDKHEYFAQDGYKLQRIWHKPQAAENLKINPFSAQDFVNKTRNKKGTYGNLIDASKEASLKRAEKLGGVDPIKNKYLENWSKKRKGKKHEDVRRAETKKWAESQGVDIEF